MCSIDWRFYCGRSELWTQLEDLVHTEAAAFGDMVLLRAHREQYRALVYKMRSVFFAALHEPFHFDFLVKLDGDVCLRGADLMRQLANTFRGHAHTELLWAGEYEPGAEHVLSPESLMYVPPHVWPARMPLPAFMHGPLYVLTRALAQVLARERDDPNVVDVGLEVFARAFTLTRSVK